MNSEVGSWGLGSSVDQKFSYLPGAIAVGSAAGVLSNTGPIKESDLKTPQKSGYSGE